MELTQGYKQTEAGLIPDDWSAIPFSELFEFRNGVNADKQAYGKGIRFVNVLEAISHSHLKAVDIPGRVSLPKRAIDSFIVRRGDMEFNRTSETLKEVGLAATYLDDEPVVFGGFVIRGRPKGKQLDPTFAGYALRAPVVRSQIIAKGQGAIRANVGQADLRQVFAPVPSLPEQQTIGKVLDDVDALVKGLTQLISKKRHLRQAALQQLVSGTTRLPECVGEWQATQLGEVAEIVNGGTPSTSVAAFWGGGIKWCTPTDVTGPPGKYLHETERTITRAGLRSCSATLLPVGTLLLCSRATIGEVKIAASEVATNQGFKSLIARRGINNEFLYYLLLTLKPKLIERAIGSTFLEISKKDTASLDIVVPDETEQVTIATVLADMDAEIAALEARREKTCALKQSMMQELLTGEEPTTMSTVGQIERATQNRVVRLLTTQLGYTYLGDWQDRLGNSNVEEGLLSDWLQRQGHDGRIVTRVLHELGQASALSGSKTLYQTNRDVYKLLRYGVKVRPEPGAQHVTVWLVDWDNLDNNDFAVAEEVTVTGENTKRPDIVVYLNGIAVAVLELKRSTVSVSEGIRQNLDSQKKEFIRPFYATVQLVLAGNDTEGLRYSVIETPEKYYLHWKEQRPGWKSGDSEENRYLNWTECIEATSALDSELVWLLSKPRLLELVHDFMVFDAGIKKTSRQNQYFGVRAAQEHVDRRVGGIIWHTQGSGKSLIMVWLAKWIREHIDDPRVLIITDRAELDEQIEDVFKGVNESIYRTNSGADLISVLNRSDEWLICSLVHKFGGSEESDVEGFLREIQSQLSDDFRAKGEIFVFVDECHRTQSGVLHEAMKALLPNATFIGFTGTPLLKRDKQKSIEIFGPYIHTYKYDEAVRDKVVLDLRYEARDIDQSITSQAKIDQWFEIKTRGLTDVAKAQLKQRWGTMQKVLSSLDRLEKIVADILLDMETRDRLRSGRGNAILVSGSIYSACRFFEMFQRTDLAGKCAIVTSYKPMPGEIKGEESGEGMTERLRQYEIYRKMLAAHFNEPEDAAVGKVELFEREVKKRFVDEPGQMKLLIVVDKLLTGFDAPSATYLYIDKQMRDHGLFQAICRVNRLDGEDKEYGYIIDYKDLFKSLEKSIQEYTGEAFDGFDEADVAGLLQDRLEMGRQRLEETREAIKTLCEPVEPPRDTAAYLRFFCGDGGDAEALKDNEPKRVALYKMAASFLRAYANLANEMADAGYSEEASVAIRAEVDHYEKVREEVKLASGDYIDMKMYEPAMRHLLDTYIRAEESETVSAFDDLPLVELIVERGETAIEALPKGIRDNRDAVAATVENNIRKVIIDQRAANPQYYEKMSQLLDAVIQARKQAALDYKAYLARVAELAQQVSRPETTTAYPPSINSAGRRALFDNLNGDEELANRVEQAVLGARRADWRGNRFKEREVRNAIRSVVADDNRAQAIFDVVRNQHEY